MESESPYFIAEGQSAVQDVPYGLPSTMHGVVPFCAPYLSKSSSTGVNYEYSNKTVPEGTGDIPAQQMFSPAHIQVPQQFQMQQQTNQIQHPSMRGMSSPQSPIIHVTNPNYISSPNISALNPNHLQSSNLGHGVVGTPVSGGRIAPFVHETLK